jgi:hypothetical protein
VSKIKTFLTENLQGVVEQKRLLDIVHLAGVLSRISGLYVPNKKHIGILKKSHDCMYLKCKKDNFFLKCESDTIGQDNNSPFVSNFNLNLNFKNVKFLAA